MESTARFAAGSPWGDMDMQRPTTAPDGLYTSPHGLDEEGPSRVFTAGEPASMLGGSLMGPSMMGGMGGSLMGPSMMSSTDSRMMRRRGRGMSKLSKDGRCSSAPLLPASQSTHTNTWFTTSAMTTSSQASNGRSLWKPLAGSFRDADSDEFGPMRKNVDDGRPFVDGTIPHYGKGSSIRKHHALEHEMAFAYYRLKRHKAHPGRKEVGDPILPPENVVSEMRSGREKQFFFWRDLRPPFKVVDVRKVPMDPAAKHPDGEVHEVVWECAIDYQGEHLWNLKSVNSTFDNTVHSTALVRIPDGFPRQRPLIVVHWGTPKTNWSPSEDVDNDGEPLRPGRVDPNQWNPIASELHERPDLPRFANVRETVRRCDAKRDQQTKPLQKLLMAPQGASLAKLAKGADRANLPQKQVKPRQHRIFTSAAGFVRYAG